MNKELLQSAKDEAARLYGHVDFDQACAYCFAMNGRTEMISVITNRAMEIYAEMRIKATKKKSKINPYEPTGLKAINSKTTKP